MFYQPNECAKTQRATLQLFLLLLVDLYLMGLQITTTLSTPIFQKERTYHLNKDYLASIAAYVMLNTRGKDTKERICDYPSFGNKVVSSVA